LPQEADPWSGQEPFGSKPSVTEAHTPSVPPVLAALHAWQTPVQALSQQTPSAQNWEVHSVLVAHA
jgi:hypothetical protein